MADIEAVAQLLADFDRAVKFAARQNFPSANPQHPNRTVPQVYEACVRRLSDQERDQLEEIIKQMMPEVEPPPRPGAHTP